MCKVNLTVTSTKTDIKNQFSGEIIFQSVRKDKFNFSYFCTHLREKEIEITIRSVAANREFNFKGLPITDQLISKKVKDELCISSHLKPILDSVLKTNMFADYVAHLIETIGAQTIKKDILSTGNSSFEADDGWFDYWLKKEPLRTIQSSN